jgi:D-tyrosyl-tRNA(Tyr) deacylase
MFGIRTLRNLWKQEEAEEIFIIKILKSVHKTKEGGGAEHVACMGGEKYKQNRDEYP